jgi:hypothetical protein
MASRLTKPVTRVIWIGDRAWNVTLGFSSVTFRAFRSPERSAVMLPLNVALKTAAWINGDKPKPKRKIKRGSL